MFNISINSVGATFPLFKEGAVVLENGLIQQKEILATDIITNKKKKQFYKRSTVLSLYAIKESIKNANIIINDYNKSRIGLFSLERCSNNFLIEETYKNLIKFCNSKISDTENFYEVMSRTYSLSDIFKLMPNLSNHLIAAELQITGSHKTFLTGQSTGLQTIINACYEIESNTNDLMFCGSSVTKSSNLEIKQIENYYDEKNNSNYLNEGAIYFILQKKPNENSIYIKGGKTFYIDQLADLEQKQNAYQQLFSLFFSGNKSTTHADIDLIIHIDEYNNKDEIDEVEIFGKLFPNSRIIIPNCKCTHNVCKGLFYLSQLYNSNYSFTNAILIERNYNNIRTFIQIKK